MRLLLTLLLVASTGACSHVVLLKTTPPGASVYIDGEVKGVTPLFFEEGTGAGKSYELRLELEGYQPERFVLQQDQWWASCVAPSLCLIPFTLGLSASGLLFARALRDEYHYLLRPVVKPAVPPLPPPEPPRSAPAAPFVPPAKVPDTAPGVPAASASAPASPGSAPTETASPPTSP
ncbi:MAG: PEGA domain-containing protein [Pseudomonadota bacterium]